jgi:hypothetical protein
MALGEYETKQNGCSRILQAGFSGRYSVAFLPSPGGGFRRSHGLLRRSDRHFPAGEVARQRGFMREQNLDIKLLLTRSKSTRRLVSGSVDYTLRAGSSFVSAARGCRADRFAGHDAAILGFGRST